MEEKKYVGSKYRVTISNQKLEYGYRDSYTSIDFHFLKEEIEGKKADFAEATLVAMKSAINHVSKIKVGVTNRKDCVAHKYIRMSMEDGITCSEMKELLIQACDATQRINLEKAKESYSKTLVAKYENEVKAFARHVKACLEANTDCDYFYQYIPCN